MNIDNTILKQIEKLAKINIDKNNKPISIDKIIGILSMLDKIKEEDINDIEPLYHPLEINQPLRNDIIDKNILRDYYQENAPKTENGLFIVPKVIE